LANVIIDASVALKWTIEEEDSAAALRLLAEDSLAAPDLFWIECANVLWTKARRGQISSDDARAALAAILAAPVDCAPSRDLSDTAQAIAFDLDDAVYDCVYLAVAMERNAVFVTSDARFHNAASAHALYKDRVRLLAAG
jgi:predicted nucleic acid-binding protein